MLMYNWLLYLFIGNDYFKGGKHVKGRKIDSCWELQLEAARGGHPIPDAGIGECGGDPWALVLAEIHLLWHRLVSVPSITPLQLSSSCVKFWGHPSLAHHIPPQLLSTGSILRSSQRVLPLSSRCSEDFHV